MLFLGMNQKFLPLASELMSGLESFIPTTNIIALLKANILLQKQWLIAQGISLFWWGRNVWVIL